MPAARQTNEEWAEQHRAAALDFLRRSLVRAVMPHVGLTEVEGHLNLRDMQEEVLALYVALPEMILAAREGKE